MSRLLIITFTILLIAIHALPGYSTPQWDSGSREEAEKDGKK